MAERLIAEMAEPWKPERYRDEYRDELMAFIKKRARTGTLASPPEAEPAEEPARRPRADVIDIADLLQKSLAGKGSRGRSKSPEAPRRPRRRKTA
jgi:DNA end-binding protein Ku